MIYVTATWYSKMNQTKNFHLAPANDLNLVQLVHDLRENAVEILNRPCSEMTGHQAFKTDQKTLARWAADCAERVLPFFDETFPDDTRPLEAIEACRKWAADGVFEMADVRRISLSSHAAARMAWEADKHAACYAARAAGHAIATAHVPIHAIGAPAYAVKAVATASDPDEVEIKVNQERTWQVQRLRDLAGGTQDNSAYHCPGTNVISAWATCHPMKGRLDAVSNISDNSRDVFLLLLAIAAGGMDALGLLALGNVFTSALSGNTILLGIAVAQGHLGEAFLCSVVFLGFIPGAIMAAVFLRSRPKSSHWSWRITLALAIEWIVLLTFVIWLATVGGSNETMVLMPLVLLSSLAMGVQYITMLRLNVNGVTTTFVTSTVVNLVCRLVVPDKSSDGSVCAKSRWTDRTNRFLASVWVCYFTGAVISAVLISSDRLYSGIFSFVLVSIVVIGTSTMMIRKGRTRTMKI
jgi:uncharacterized membrane protein YoaK (UPF0700 family)